MHILRIYKYTYILQNATVIRLKTEDGDLFTQNG